MSEQLTQKDISMTFAKGLQVLTAFDANDRELTIPSIAKKTKLNRTVVRRLVLTLQYYGYLESRNRVYRLTPHILSLASGFLQGRDLGKHVTPIMRTFSDQLSEDISFAMLDIDQAIYVAHSPGDSTMITQGFTVGTRLPLQATAIGRALIAFSKPETQEHILESVPRVPFTPDTIVELDKLGCELETTVKQGFALVKNEFEQGVTSLAVPVLSADGELIGALGIVGPNPRFEDEKIQVARIKILQKCAKLVAIYTG
ncbi:IclR family transcriptional regulator [Saccharospirillum sp.]|uniref:IclR family transcriptional regulator n=1 Tax=Saccharospirillum sp. TaxID=2033801 RepID=UPI0034A01BF2